MPKTTSIGRSSPLSKSINPFAKFGSPPDNDLITEARNFQKSVNDLVVFSFDVKAVVRLGWPLDLKTLLRIVPLGIRDWLRSRMLHWACFCGLTASNEKVRFPSRIVHSLDGRVFVFCHHEPSQCGFHLDLNKIHEKTQMVARYMIPTIGKTIPAGLKDDLLAGFALQVLLTDKYAPLFPNYAGDQANGVVQLASQPSGHGPWAPAGTRIRPNMPKAIFYPSSDDEPTTSKSTGSQIDTGSSSAAEKGKGIDTDFRLKRDQSVLRRLAAGNGVQEYEWEGIAEKCDRCEYVYLTEVFKEHLAKCDGSSPDSDSNEESE